MRFIKCDKQIAGIDIVANQNDNAPPLNRSGESGDFLMCELWVTLGRAA